MPSRLCLEAMHRDLVKHEWSAGQDVLMERMEPDDPRAEGAGRWKQALDGSATYISISAPHSNTNCPFRDADLTLDADPSVP